MKTSLRAKRSNPIIGIIMGSDSDLPVMKAAAEQLEEFDIPFEITIVSAHRTPDWMYEYAKGAAGRDIKVVIAGAGGAAHLPGMTAALTHLPVIGVPIQSKTMSGLDSLYSIVQMPPGIPVATVAINGAKNAAILAAKIIAVDDEKIAKKIITFMNLQQTEVEVKVTKLAKKGYKRYTAKSK